MPSLAKLFERNRNWALRMRNSDPDFFSRMADEQAPKHLWIGCADSRVPATQVVDCPPGHLFVHRNVANIVGDTDLNALAVLQFAVESLKVTDVIVCGHYGCGGIAAAMGNSSKGVIDRWISGIRELMVRHQPELDELDTLKEREDRLCELNVLEQVRNVAGSSIVTGAWSSGQKLTIHGLIYDLNDGHLHDMGLTISARVSH